MKTRKKEALGTQRTKAALGNWREKSAIGTWPLARKPAIDNWPLARKPTIGNWPLAISKSKPETKTRAQEPPTEPDRPKRRRQGKFTLKDLNYPDQRVVRFPMAVGKKTEMIELLTSANLHYITVEFADRTSLSFMIEPAFTFSAGYEYLEKGKPRAKLWPEIRSR